MLAFCFVFKWQSVEDPRYKVSERVCREIVLQEVTAFIHEIAIGVFYSHGGRWVTEGTINDKGPSFLHANITWYKSAGEWSLKKINNNNNDDDDDNNN